MYIDVYRDVPCSGTLIAHKVKTLDAFEFPVRMSSLQAELRELDSPAPAFPSVRARKRRAEAESSDEEALPLPQPESDSVGKGRARNYCFTVNSEPKRFYNHWKTCDLPTLVQYIVYQKEVAPKTGHLHIQGYVQLTKPLSKKQVQVLLRSNAHLEAAKGTAAHNKAYCTKSDTRLDGTDPVERGAPKEQGRRTDLEALAQRVVTEGRVSQEMIKDHPAVYVRNYRGLQALAQKIAPPAGRGCPKVIYMVGSPGCGKSRLAHLMFPGAYSCTDQKEAWFDGYTNESSVIFDDFEGNFNLRSMLKLLDYYPLQLPVKGGFVPIVADTFVFTSNIDPSACYCGNEAWMRRLKQFGEIWDAEKVQRLLHDRLSIAPPPLRRSNAASVIDLTQEAACAHGNQEDSCPTCRE